MSPETPSHDICPVCGEYSALDRYGANFTKQHKSGCMGSGKNRGSLVLLSTYVWISEFCKKKLPDSEYENISNECLDEFKSLAKKMFKHYDEDYIMNEFYNSCKTWFGTKKPRSKSSAIADLPSLDGSEGHAA